MPLQIDIQPIPNQSFSVTLNDKRYVFTIKTINNMMVADIERDDVMLTQGVRIVAGEPLIPFTYLEDGNLIVITNNDEIPYYTSFGDSQFLVYLTPVELEAARNGS